MRKIIAVILTAMVLAGTFSACSTETVEPDIDQIKNICELVTYDCVYNNVVKSANDNKIGKQRDYWIEYKAVASIGIDFSKVEMEINDDVVTISLPEGELLHVRTIEDSFTDATFYVDGKSQIHINKITETEQSNAVAIAQQLLEEEIKADTHLLNKGQERAKDLIENYINSISELSGKEYTIVWKTISSAADSSTEADAPDDTSETVASDEE